MDESDPENKYTAEGAEIMTAGFYGEEMVECRYKGIVSQVPLKTYLRMAMNTQIDGKKFIRYKDGAWIYSMSESEFNRLAHDAEAIYKLDKKVLIKVALIDDYMEYFRLRNRM